MRIINLKTWKTIAISALLLAAFCLPVAVHGDPRTSVDTNSSLHIMLSLSLAGSGLPPGVPLQLNFGEIITGNVSNAITLTPQGVRSARVAGSLGSSTGVIVPTLAVAGNHNTSINIILPSSATISNGAATMTVSGFTQNLGATPILDANGNALFSVGATLNVGANQPTGQYTGTFAISVAYQ